MLYNDNRGRARDIPAWRLASLLMYIYKYSDLHLHMDVLWCALRHTRHILRQPVLVASPAVMPGVGWEMLPPKEEEEEEERVKFRA